MLRLLALGGALAVLSACGSFGDHVVKRGETLYSISWRYGQDYRELAQWNRIPPPYIIHEGQRLRVTPPPGAVTAPATAPAAKKQDAGNDSGAGHKRQGAGQHPAPAAQRPLTKAPAPRRLTWVWPAEGQLVSRFSARDAGRKGIDIAGRPGAAVRAAAPGRVVYSGDGIPRYGNLLIIKHNDKFLSAYAHNRRLLVREGAVVKQGQQIAEMGRSGTGVDRVMLHFEIRADGVPVDPLAYLPRKAARAAPGK